MADLLIKNMEMPKDEYVDVRIFKDGRAIANQADANEPNSHYATFNAIAVPPHGRLVDADKFDLKYITFIKMKDGKEFETYDAPTVLEASE